MRWRLVAGGLALLMAGALAAETWQILTPGRALETRTRVFEIPPQQGVLAIARRLHAAELIRSPRAFVALSLLRGTARQLQAGEYEAPAGASTLEVLALLEAGRVRQHTVLHPEGATAHELARALEAERLATATDVARAASVEGYLFPDTYQFVRGMTAEEILTRMVQRLRAKLTPELQAHTRARGLTVHELLTLASIIEREAVAREEMKLISAVFWNRLKLDMPLQADPTVQYALGKARQSLTRADLQTDHPFNTYRRSGLPPGPIASPGLLAIRAALEPAPVKYLYFVAVDERHHHFSTTVEEHSAAVARYRLTRARLESRTRR